MAINENQLVAIEILLLVVNRCNMILPFYFEHAYTLFVLIYIIPNISNMTPCSCFYPGMYIEINATITLSRSECLKPNAA